MVTQYRLNRLKTAGLAALVLVAGSFGAFAAGAKSLSNGFTGAEAAVRSGMWWNPGRPGHGIDLHLAGDTLFLVWYTYTDEGLPVWYLAAAPWEGETWTATLDQYTWSPVSKSAQPAPAGSVTLRFSDTTHASFEWSLGAEQGAEPFELFQIAGAIAPEDHTGHWWVPQEPGYGLTLNNQGSFEFAVLYFYDQSGFARWALGDNGGEMSETLELRSYISACPSCADLATSSALAGTIDRRFSSETRGRLSIDINLPPPLAGQWQVDDRRMAMASDPPSGRAHDAALAQFASGDALERFLKEGLQNAAMEFFGPMVDVGFAPAPEGGFSTTNLQEAGVDEADLIKSDGSILYAAINDLYAFKGVAPTAPNRIRVLALKESPFGITPLTNILFGDVLERPLDGMYLITGREDEAPDLLAAVTGRPQFFVEPLMLWPSPWPWINGVTELFLFNVDDPANPAQLVEISIDGHLLASRRIGESLYLVTRHTPNVEGLMIAPGTEEDAEANAALLEQLALTDLLPDFRVDGERLGDLVDASAAFLPPIPGGYTGTDLITLTRIDLGNPAALPVTVTIVGQTETVYASTKAFYLATTSFAYPIDFGFIQYPETITTDIHKFGLVDGLPEYRGSASVPGHLGWDVDNKPFRMGEHDDVLRVVTSSDFAWGQMGQNRLTLLAEAGDPPSKGSGGPLLKEIAHLPNAQRPQTLGKPDERLYGTRFVGDKLFAVTFLQIDPLIVVDLSNPADPFINGELEIPGFSDYLHPVNEDLLVGVGKDAVVVEGEIGDGRFAWFQGVKIGLFNVSDPAMPVELDSLVIGRRGSESEVLFDHHAFGFLAEETDKARPARFTIPVSVHDAASASEISPDPTTWYEWHHTGLYLFDIVGDSLVSGGAVIGADRTTHQYDPYDQFTGGNRALIWGDAVFYVPRGDVFSAPWNQPEMAVGPQ